MAKDDCIYHNQNTTVISLYNGSARDRHITRAEVRRGIDQLIKDCGLEGGFTGIHVVNNLTFAAYGTSGGINRAPPPRADRRRRMCPGVAPRTVWSHATVSRNPMTAAISRAATASMSLRMTVAVAT